MILFFLMEVGIWSGSCHIRGSIKELSWTRENHCQFLKMTSTGLSLLTSLWKWSGHLVKLPPTVIFKLKGVKKDDRKPTNVKIIRFPERQSNFLVTIIQRKFEIGNFFFSTSEIRLKNNLFLLENEIIESYSEYTTYYFL